MNRRIICPHCRRPIDPLTLEVAVSAQAHYRICPECDEAIALFVSGDALSGEGDDCPVLRQAAFSVQEPQWL